MIIIGLHLKFETRMTGPQRKIKEIFITFIKQKEIGKFYSDYDYIIIKVRYMPSLEVISVCI